MAILKKNISDIQVKVRRYDDDSRRIVCGATLMCYVARTFPTPGGNVINVRILYLRPF